MQPTMSLTGTAGLVCLLLLSPALRAAEWNGSYAANGRCYCSGTLPPSLAARIVPTPLGGQSVATVCARIGDGPGLSQSKGRFDRVVYADAQCGHGPFSAISQPLPEDCSGTREPGADDCQAAGPEWDLETAYRSTNRDSTDQQALDQASASAVVESISTVDGVGAAVAPPVLGAAAGRPAVASDATAAAADAVIVKIDGRRWRQAPVGTPETGAPGSRIILDGRVYVDADKTPASFFARPETARRQVARRTTKPSSQPADLIVKRQETAEAVRARQARLLDEARQRLAGKDSDKPAVGAALERVEDDEERQVALSAAEKRAIERRQAREAEASQAAADRLAAERLAAREAALLARAEEQRIADQAAAELAADEAARNKARNTARIAAMNAAREKQADAVDSSVDAMDADPMDADKKGSSASSVLSALRMPDAVRASTREFGYLDAMPINYDFGGGGIALEGSAVIRESFRLLAKLGAASDYRELLVGASYFITPPMADRMTLVMTAGVETGEFELQRGAVNTDLSDTGVHVAAGSRFVVNDRFELQAGVGYSSFFDGDPFVFGGGFYHLGHTLDLISRVELGDNDSLGIGVRYYY